MTARRRTGWLVRAVTDDLGLKVLSLVASLAVFYLVRGSEDAQRSLFVDVVALLPDDRRERVLVSEVPERVRVTLEGSRSVLNSLQREGLGALQVDLRAEPRGYHYFDGSALGLPTGVRVVQIAPASFPLRWEARRTRRLPVRARLAGRPADGLAVDGEPTVRPEALRAVGPASDIEPLESLVTEPVAVADLGMGEHARRVEVRSPSPRVSLGGDGTVEVTIRVAPEVARRPLPPAPVAVPGASARTWIRPRRATVTLVGPPDRVASVDVATVVPWADVPDGTAGQRDVPAPVRVRGLPDGVQAEVEPDEVLVTLPR